MGRGGLSNLWVNNLDWFCFDLLWHTKPSYILCQFLNYANKYKILNEFKVCYFPESLKSQYLWFLRDCLWSTLTGLGSFKYAPEALNWFLSQTALNLISFWKANSKKKKKKSRSKCNERWSIRWQCATWKPIWLSYLGIQVVQFYPVFWNIVSELIGKLTVPKFLGSLQDSVGESINGLLISEGSINDSGTTRMTAYEKCWIGENELQGVLKLKASNRYLIWTNREASERIFSKGWC